MTLFLLLLALTSILLVTALIRPRLIYEYPYFMAAAFMTFILPQAYALVRQGWASSYMAVTLVVGLLCLSACWLGYQLPARSRWIERLNVPVNPSRFLHAGIAFVITGFVFNHLIEMLPEDEKGSMWTGRITIYSFFGQLIYPGFAICFYSAVRTRSLFAWLVALVAATIPLELAVVYARREATTLFLLTLVLTFFFHKGWSVPRWGIALAIFAVTLFIPATSEYRTLAQDDPLGAIRQINFTEQFKNYFDEDAISEVRNATILIAATQETGDYELGAGYWNRIIFRFVPAQILGQEFKDSLMIGGEQRDYGEFVEDALGTKISVGSTLTGIGDSFNQLGYFGCLFFAGVAYLFKNLWTAAMQENGTVAQILYIQITTTAMRALTHQTIDFLPGLIYSGVFIAIVALYARESLPVPEDSEMATSENGNG